MKKKFRNGLPVDAATAANVEETNWGRVSNYSRLLMPFDNNPESRKLQDVGWMG